MWVGEFVAHKKTYQEKGIGFASNVDGGYYHVTITNHHTKETISRKYPVSMKTEEVFDHIVSDFRFIDKPLPATTKRTEPRDKPIHLKNYGKY